MQAKHLIHELLRRSMRHRAHHTNPYLHFACNALCTVTELPKSDFPESPDLPSWLKSPEPPVTDSSCDDFVIPSLASWVESHNLQDRSKFVRPSPVEQPIKSDADKISGILKNRYPSPESFVEALDGCGVDVSDSLVAQILKRFSNDWAPAFGVFTWAKTQTGYVHSSELYNAMVDILGKCKKFNLMWELVKEMDGFKGYVTLVTMTQVMRRLARAGRYEEAIEAFKGLEQFGVEKDINALNVLLDALVKENSVEHAYEVFLEFKDLTPLNLRTFNILIHGWCKARKFDDAQKMMNEMERHGFRPNAVTYTSFVESYSREKDFRKVDAIMDEMGEKGCKPSVVTYTIVMHALGKAGQINEALNVYEQMKKDCVPDAPFYSSLIFILNKAGRLKDANEVFEDMEKQGVSRDLLTYNSMISSACAHSQEENALKLLRKMEKDSCKPDHKTYAPLLKMCCRKKWMKVLDFLLSHMFKNDVSIDLGTFTLLIHELCKSGKLDRACLFFEEAILKGMIPMDSTCRMLVEKLEHKNMTVDKERIELSMLRAVE
ncbi:pentatricopeptide repeat-containing protein [Tripterygium wilfordii]|uniref:Pentatricopeptide repeat-containing protein n=2 Tax=Tripterygium wilfordii TaxID=458696 RepID=A0A7J7CX51_TRIWF|nr:pentatricopeptide repeat-containing protein [Tripterygium wilfordii]